MTDQPEELEEMRVGIFRWGEQFIAVLGEREDFVVAVADTAARAVEEGFKRALPGVQHIQWQMPAAMQMDRQFPEASQDLIDLVEQRAADA